MNPHRHIQKRTRDLAAPADRESLPMRGQAFGGP